MVSATYFFGLGRRWARSDFVRRKLLSWEGGASSRDIVADEGDRYGDGGRCEDDGDGRWI